MQNVAIAICGCLLPLSGWGADLDAALRGSVEYDTNVRRTESNETDDWIFRITPLINMIEDDGKFQWNVQYQMPYVRAIDTSKLNGFRHFANIDSNYYFNGRTQAFFRDQFQYSESVQSTTSVESGSQTPVVNTFGEPVFRNRMVLGTQHAFTPRLNGNLALSWRLFDTDIANRANNNVFVANMNSNYALTPHHRVGGGVAATFQDFQRSNNGVRPPQQALFVNFFATWSWFIDETTSFEITFGPTFIDTFQDAPPSTIPNAPEVPFGEISSTTLVVNDISTCEVLNGDSVVPLGGTCPGLRQLDEGNPDSGVFYDVVKALDSASVYSFGPGAGPIDASDTSWTLFGGASLSKRWTPTLVSTLSYQRRDSTASGVAGSATMDIVTFLTSWRITELWNTQVRADFTQRESVSPQLVTLLVLQPTAMFDSFGNAFFAGGATPTGELVQRVVDQALDTQRWGVSARLERRITENLRTALRYSFNNQSSKRQTAGSRSDFMDHLVTLSVQYDFDRWHLW